MENSRTFQGLCEPCYRVRNRAITKGRAPGISPAIFVGNKKKMRPKELPGCSVPHLNELLNGLVVVDFRFISTSCSIMSSELKHELVMKFLPPQFS